MIKMMEGINKQSKEDLRVLVLNQMKRLDLAKGRPRAYQPEVEEFDCFDFDWTGEQPEGIVTTEGDPDAGTGINYVPDMGYPASLLETKEKLWVVTGSGYESCDGDYIIHSRSSVSHAGLPIREGSEIHYILESMPGDKMH